MPETWFRGKLPLMRSTFVFPAVLALCSHLAACVADDNKVPKDGSAIAGGNIDANSFDAGAKGDATTDLATVTDALSLDATRDTEGDTASLQPGVVMPYNYLKKGDSPFGSVNFAWFHFEDLEDHLFNVPGVSNGGGRLSSTFGAGLIDSVDGDDGTANDNRCIKTVGTCDAWWGAGSLRFTFDANSLGGLPTHVGLVWTDGGGKVSFEAFDAAGLSLYKFGPYSEQGFPDDTVNSSTTEDRFFGAYSPLGIGSVLISNTAGGVEIDHLQYGKQL